MSEESKRAKGRQVSATVSAELFDALEEWAWDNRKKRTDVVRLAVEEFADRNNIYPTGFKPAELSGNDADE